LYGLVARATVNDQAFMCNLATQEHVTLPLGTPDVHIVMVASITLVFYLATVNDQAFMCNLATQERVTLPLGTPDVHIVMVASITLGFYLATLSRI
jgi:hypothetical protein